MTSLIIKQNKKNIIHFIKAKRLRWLGHVERRAEERDVKKIYKLKLIASRPVGSPKIRRMDNVMRDIQAMKFLIGKGEDMTEINGTELLSRPKHLQSMDEYKLWNGELEADIASVYS
jgi:hypothetical protein